MANSYNTLHYEPGRVGRLTLCRPDRLNSFTIEMWRELRELGEELCADPGELRALVVIGEGRAFSSGIDTSVFSEPTATAGVFDSADSADERHLDPVVAGILTTQDSYSWLADAPFATIAAVRGFALGAGLQLALACDLRVIARGTRVGLLEFKYGIIPDLGGTQRLPRLVGAGKAAEMILTSAQIDAEEAHRIGLAERLVSDEELEEVADDLAKVIAAQPPLAVRGAKRALSAAISGLSMQEGLLIEAEAQSVCLRSEDMKEAITAFIEQRSPEYRGR